MKELGTILIGTTYLGIYLSCGTLYLNIEYESLASNNHSEELPPEKAKELLNLLKTTIDKHKTL